MSGSSQAPVKAFLFDMGDVLIKFSHSRMFAQIADVLDRSADDVKRLFQDTGLFVGYDRGDIDDDEAISRIEAFVGRPIDRRRLLHAMSDIFEPSPGMFELLTELKRRGYRMVLLSNTCRPHIELVRERFPIYGLLDDYVLVVRGPRGEAGAEDFRGGIGEDRRSRGELLLHRRHSGVRRSGTQLRFAGGSLHGRRESEAAIGGSGDQNFFRVRFVVCGIWFGRLGRIELAVNLGGRPSSAEGTAAFRSFDTGTAAHETH